MSACVVEGCDKPRYGAYRLCAMHRTRKNRTGNLEAPPPKRMPKGADHWNWQKVPTYTAVHDRLRAWRGSARNQTCACGQPARQWSFTGDAALVSPEGWPYSADLAAYVARCVPCHKKADLARIRC